MISGLLRGAATLIALPLILVGGGARMTGVAHRSPLDYWVGTGAIVVAAVLLLFVLIKHPVTRVKAPASGTRWATRAAIGAAYMAVGAILLVSAVSLAISISADPGGFGRVMRRVAWTPDIVTKMLSALLAVGAGAAAIANVSVSTGLVRCAAIFLFPIWPIGTIASIAGSWATIGEGWDQKNQ